MSTNNLTTQQKRLLASIAGLEDQIRKGHFVKAHFRALEIANDAWQEHIRQNAVAGARLYNSPAGAVLDESEEDR